MTDSRVTMKLISKAPLIRIMKHYVTPEPLTIRNIFRALSRDNNFFVVLYGVRIIRIKQVLHNSELAMKYKRRITNMFLFISKC